jgi:hypothetical protein
MRFKVGIILTVVGVVAYSAFSMQRLEAQAEPTTMYTRAPMQLTVSTASGQVLASLEIPVGVTLSISAAGVAARDAKHMPTTFTGDVSIRTRPTSDMVDGPLREQMLTAPFQLDVKDALVVLTPRGK